MKKFSPEELIKLKGYWRSMRETQDRYHNNIYAIETVMEKDIGIEGIEFFRGHDGYICGIGTANKEYELVQFDLMEE